MDSQARANSVDTDQTWQTAASDQGPHCLQFIQHILDALTGNNMDVQILGPVWWRVKVSQYLE